MEASPQDYLIIAKICKDLRRFALESADAVERSYYPEHLKLRLQTQKIAHYFKLLGECSEKFASAQT